MSIASLAVHSHLDLQHVEFLNGGVFLVDTGTPRTASISTGLTFENRGTHISNLIDAHPCPTAFQAKSTLCPAHFLLPTSIANCLVAASPRQRASDWHQTLAFSHPTCTSRVVHDGAHFVSTFTSTTLPAIEIQSGRIAANTSASRVAEPQLPISDENAHFKLEQNNVLISINRPSQADVGQAGVLDGAFVTGGEVGRTYIKWTNTGRINLAGGRMDVNLNVLSPDATLLWDQVVTNAAIDFGEGTDAFIVFPVLERSLFDFDPDAETAPYSLGVQFPVCFPGCSSGSHSCASHTTDLVLCGGFWHCRGHTRSRLPAAVHES